MYIYKTEYLKEINGYDESFILFGFEELDFNQRIQKHFGLSMQFVEKRGYVYHLTHGDALRGSLSNYDLNKNKMHENAQSNLTVVNLNKEWGKFKIA